MAISNQQSAIGRWRDLARQCVVTTKRLALIADCWLLTASLLVFSVEAWACPLCKEALFDPGQAAAQSGVVRGYAVSIAAMLGVPALIIGGIGVAIARSARRLRRG